MTLSRLPGFSPARLAALRAERELSVRDLADLADCTPDAVRKWESGAMAPDPRRACALAEALRIPVRKLTDLPDENIGLAELRAFQGLTARDLATQTGIGRTTISRIELGDREPSDEQAQAFATALNLSISQIIDTWTRLRERRLNDVRSRTQL